jgi:UDP-N-acetylmuramyl pentapeptide phosphotransferase/UDP-N-acetylglucosamine-1-phosphate transferase
LAALIALSGIRIQSFGGFLGIEELPETAQYTFTILTIVAITNAFNLIDGIDGLAGGIGFMSLITLGLFLTISGDANTALIAFALAGGILAFLYFNFNPARIFMGDTGSLVLGFVAAVLCIRLIQVNDFSENPVLPQGPIFVLGIVLIPVFDTIRVFASRIWNQGFSHGFASKFICSIHGFTLILAYWLRNVKQEYILCIFFVFMLLVTSLLKNMYLFRKKTGNHSSFAGTE